MGFISNLAFVTCHGVAEAVREFGVYGGMSWQKEITLRMSNIG